MNVIFATIVMLMFQMKGTRVFVKDQVIEMVVVLHHAIQNGKRDEGQTYE